MNDLAGRHFFKPFRVAVFIAFEVLKIAASASTFSRANFLNLPEIRFSCATACQKASANFWASPYTSSVWAAGTIFSTPNSCATTSPAIGMQRMGSLSQVGDRCQSSLTSTSETLP